MVVVVALVASIGLNVLLLATRDSGESQQPTTHSTARSAPITVGQRASTPLGHDGVSAKPGASRYRDLDRATLEHRLAKAEARIAKLLPPDERFKLGEPNPENEERLRPHLDRLFNAKPGDDAPYELECRDDICHLTTSLHQSEWMERLQQDEQLSGTFAGIQFGATTYMIMAEPGKAAGFRLLGRVLRSLYEGDASKLISECKRNNPARAGTLSVSVNLDSAARKFIVTVDGELAKQSLGVCVRRVVDDTMARLEIPGDVTMMQEASFPISVP